MKKIISLLLALAMVLCMAACGSTTTTTEQAETAAQNADTPAQEADSPAQEDDTPAEADEPAEVSGHIGTIMWLSNLSSGLQYDTSLAYITAICDQLGYDVTVVYGDIYNDAAGNLNAVKNGMTSDVVGLIASQDGGLLSIMEEFPDLYVCGYNSDMRSVYGGGENAACLENDHFLGTICDGYGNGTQMGIDNANHVIEKGYKKVAVVSFPGYAYPNLTEADVAFRAAIEEYNAAADEPVEIVGDTLVLEFQPLPESYFLEEGHGDLDCIIGFCAGLWFIYPTMAVAIANGTCSADTKLVTGGFDDDPDIVANIGDEGTIAFIQFSPAEDPAYALALLDGAITGNPYPDFENVQIDSAPYTIDSTEDIENVMNKSMAGTGDLSLAQLTVDEVVNLCRRFNPDATQQQLIETMHSDQVMVDALKSR